jgi:hypothetical protein
MPIEGTEDGNNIEATPVHLGCIQFIVYNREEDAIYIDYPEEEND